MKSFFFLKRTCLDSQILGPETDVFGDRIQWIFGQICRSFGRCGPKNLFLVTIFERLLFFSFFQVGEMLNVI